MNRHAMELDAIDGMVKHEIAIRKAKEEDKDKGSEK